MPYTHEDRIRNLKKMYTMYRDAKATIAAERVLARLQELGLTAEEVDDLRSEYDNA